MVGIDTDQRQNVEYGGRSHPKQLDFTTLGDEHFGNRQWKRV